MIVNAGPARTFASPPCSPGDATHMVPGFQASSAKMAHSAAVSVRPVPAAVMLSSATYRWAGALKNEASSGMALRRSGHVAPRLADALQPAPHTTSHLAFGVVLESVAVLLPKVRGGAAVDANVLDLVLGKLEHNLVHDLRRAGGAGSACCGSRDAAGPLSQTQPKIYRGALTFLWCANTSILMPFSR